MKCYFCQAIIPDTITIEENTCDFYYTKCPCVQKPIENIYLYASLHKVHFVNITMAYGDYNLIITLYLDKQYTTIRNSNSMKNKIIRLPGFPLNPQNIEKKLPLYLLFS